MKKPANLLILWLVACGQEGADSVTERAAATVDEAGGAPRGKSRLDEPENTAADASLSGAELDRTREAQRVHSDPEGAVVEGVVVYQADPERRWRQARYYVKDPGAGQLAEAVVSLRGADLKSPSEGAEPRTWSIDQKNFQFVPEILGIHAGDSVRFTNSDREIHNVRTIDGVRGFNVSLPGGSEYVHEFPRAGGIDKPVRLGCVFHGSMRAWIYVFDHGVFRVTGGDGRFRFEGVPPGEYWLDMVHPAGGFGWSRQVKIRSGDTMKVDINVSADDGITEKR